MKNLIPFVDVAFVQNNIMHFSFLIADNTEFAIKALIVMGVIKIFQKLL